MTRRPRPTDLGEFPPITGESARSRRYAAGKAVRYSGRIHGPTFPVETYSIDDLPDDSILKPPQSGTPTHIQEAAMAVWFANAGIAHKATAPTRDDLYKDLGHGKANE